MKIRFESVNKIYFNQNNKVVVFENFNFEFSKQGLVCFLGPSGCGKTTMLHLLSRLVEPDKGKIDVKPNKAKISYVFQEPRLLPWRTVKENIQIVLTTILEVIVQILIPILLVIVFLLTMVYLLLEASIHACSNFFSPKK